MGLGAVTRAWLSVKLLLLSVLLLVPTQYDTSSQLLIPEPAKFQLSLQWALNRVVSRLTIWDSVYFTTLAQRGTIYEHEWAFGRLWWLSIRGVAWLACQLTGKPPTLYTHAAASICLSNVSHYVGCVLLYHLTRALFPRRPARFAQTTAVLYALSPAGIFLVAGYAEPTFAALSFAGLLLRHSKYYVLSGLVFAISCGYRSNGLLWGILFLYDLVTVAYADYKTWTGPRAPAKSLESAPSTYSSQPPAEWSEYSEPQRKPRFVIPVLRTPLVAIREYIRIIIGGSLIGSSIAVVQVYAYTIFCPDRAEWCNKAFPSITEYIQAKYWGVGFLWYWTPNNIPNFLFALPTMLILFVSFRWSLAPGTPIVPAKTLLPLAIVQAVTALSALLVWNVQIITRISTCLPIYYWYAAHRVSGTTLGDVRIGRRIVVYTSMWILAQAVLFAAFLPPA